jgi:hypothetical protein
MLPEQRNHSVSQSHGGNHLLCPDPRSLGRHERLVHQSSLRPILVRTPKIPPLPFRPGTKLPWLSALKAPDAVLKG